MARYKITAQDSAISARPLWPLLAASAGTLIAAPLYVALLDVPLIRATGLPIFLLTGVAAVAGAIYVRRDDRGWVRIGGAANMLAILAAACWFFWLAALPVPQAAAAALEQAPDFRLLDQNRRPVALSELYRRGKVLLVFYRGSWCPFCVSELRGLASVHDELMQSGVQIVAVSVDPISKTSTAAERLGLRFPLLSDTERTAIRAYGLVHAGGGPGGEDVALPAQFLIGRDGRILWRRLAGRIQDRPDPRAVLEHIRAAGARF